jgi:hypothetical protein
MSGGRAAALLGLALALNPGCDDGDRYPWEQPGPPPRQSADPKPTATTTEQSATNGPQDPPHGGLFETCLAGLVAERDPVRDVTRLVTVCGPSTGMTPVDSNLREGALADGAPVVLELPLQRGRCYRIFAVADAGISELDLEVKTSRGTLVAQDHMTGRIAVAQPDRPFCTEANETASLTVKGVGAGAFALDVLWVGSGRH